MRKIIQNYFLWSNILVHLILFYIINISNKQTPNYIWIGRKGYDEIKSVFIVEVVWITTYLVYQYILLGFPCESKPDHYVLTE